MQNDSLGLGFNDEADSPLAKAFEAAANDPQNTDFGFVAEREASGFANFGFDPAEAKRLRDAEIARAEAELDEEDEDWGDDEDYFDDEDDFDDEADFDDDYDDTDWEDEELLTDEEEDEDGESCQLIGGREEEDGLCEC